MDEIAPLAVHAAVVLFEVLAVFRLVFVVHLVVLQQLVRTVREFATAFVGTEAVVHEPSAQFRFLLGVFGVYGTVGCSRLVGQGWDVFFVVGKGEGNVGMLAKYYL